MPRCCISSHWVPAGCVVVLGGAAAICRPPGTVSLPSQSSRSSRLSGPADPSSVHLGPLACLQPEVRRWGCAGCLLLPAAWETALGVSNVPLDQPSLPPASGPADSGPGKAIDHCPRWPCRPRCTLAASPSVSSQQFSDGKRAHCCVAERRWGAGMLSPSRMWGAGPRGRWLPASVKLYPDSFSLFLINLQVKKQRLCGHWAQRTCIVALLFGHFTALAFGTVLSSNLIVRACQPADRCARP